MSCALGIGSTPVVSTAQVSPALNPSTPAIVTTGTGEAKLTPDRASVYIGVQSRASSASAAARDNAQRQRAVIDAIVSLGISRQLISTENYSVSPETRFDPNTQQSSVTGYVVSNVVRVEVQRIDQVAAVIDASLGKGANQINSLDFYASNSDEARRQALASAITNARGDAEAMARAAGGSLGLLLELTSTDNGPRPVFRAAAAAANGVMTPIEAGQQTLRVSVVARWQFVATK
jgi:uncharacterized protein YggE